MDDRQDREYRHLLERARIRLLAAQATYDRALREMERAKKAAAAAAVCPAIAYEIDRLERDIQRAISTEESVVRLPPLRVFYPQPGVITP